MGNGFGVGLRLRLFLVQGRIPCRMSATFTSTAFQSGLAATAAKAILFFSTQMADENKAVAQGLRQRDPELLDRLIEQYQYRLFRYLVYLTSSRERAEDFFQETWIRVLERGHQYDGKSKFEAWLFAIARHLVIDWQRSKKMQSLDSLIDPEEGTPREFAAENEPSPLYQVMAKQAEAGVHRSLEKIPAVYREVLLLRFQEELQLDEIAGVLGTPLSTVKSRLYRGLASLKGALQGGAA
jgi:RNA polymerase sigma-70 factor (ECF subfamily)